MQFCTVFSILIYIFIVPILLLPEGSITHFHAAEQFVECLCCYSASCTFSGIVGIAVFCNLQEFQKTLGAKHSVYDTTTRSGRSLKEKATLNEDIHKLDDMLSEIRDKWDTVCGKSVER